MSAPTVIFAGGGSGGHLFPNMAVAERLPDASHAYLVSSRAVDAGIVAKNSLDAVALPAAPLSLRPRGAWRFLKNWGASVRAARGVIASAKARGPVAVLASGGFVSAPAMQAAKAEGVWSAIVNLDATPGKASRFAARVARERYIVSDDPPDGWTALRPVVRAAFDALPDPDEARARLGLARSTPTLLVTGGSQGARSLNLAMARALRENPAALAGWQALHQASGDDANELRDAYDSAGVPATIVPFIDDMPAAWASADLAVARGGAGTVGEAWASRTPLIALPYPHHGDDHQLKNIAAMNVAGAAFAVIDRMDPALTAPALLDELETVIGDLDSVRAAAAALPPPDGARTLADRLRAGLDLHGAS